MLNLPKVKDFMDQEVHSLRPDTEILDAVDFLLDQHVTGAPVVDDAGRIIGILSEKDCLRLLAAGSDADVPQGTVEGYMTKEVQTVPRTMNIYFCAGLFLNTSVRRFPVVDADNKVVGAITRFDILRAIQKEMHKKNVR